jgi:hypothetical protein
VGNRDPRGLQDFSFAVHAVIFAASLRPCHPTYRVQTARFSQPRLTTQQRKPLIVEAVARTTMQNS